MSDLTERLERYAKEAMPNYPNDICSQAKQEIESLRDRLAMCRNQYDAAMKRIDALQEELGRF